MKNLIILYMVISMIGVSQGKQKIQTESGRFQLGLRTAISAFKV